MLQDVADLAAQLLVEQLAVEVDRARLERQPARDGVQQGRLAGAAGAHDGQDLARSDDARHLAQQGALPHRDGQARKVEIHRPGLARRSVTSK